MAKYEMNEIGKKILKIRNQIDITQDAFGELLKTEYKKEGYERKTISEWENNKKLPTLDAILKICEVGNVDIGYLVGDPDYKQGTITATRFQEETGLSDEAIEKLRAIRKDLNSTITLFAQDGNETSDDAIPEEMINLSKVIGYYDAADEISEVDIELSEVIRKDVPDFVSYIITSKQFDALMKSVRRIIDRTESIEKAKAFRKPFNIPAEMSFEDLTPEEYEELLKGKVSKAINNIVEGYIDKRINEEKKI